MNEGISLETVKPSEEEAIRRYNFILGDTWEPPLSEAEKANVLEACRRGGAVFIRCTWDNSFHAALSQSSKESK